MMTFKELTVVIPVYNRADDIVRCLDSLAEQTVRPGRIVVVDDGSTDGTWQSVRNHPLAPDLLSAPHSGSASARNVGLEAVDTEWVMFFDSDDIMRPGHIELASGAPLVEADIVGWDVERTALDGASRRLPFETSDIRWHNLMHGTLATQRYMARTALVRAAGGWNGEMRIWNDIELGARLLALNPRVVKVQSRVGPTVCILARPESVTGATWSSRADLYEAPLRSIAATLGPTHSDWIALKRAILAADIAREDKVAGRDMYCAIKELTPAVRLAYRYRLWGGRGGARLLRPFFSKSH